MTDTMMEIIAAAEYVNISRDEFEDWLDSWARGKWVRKDSTAGIYNVELSDNVAIQISSSIGSRGEVLNRGNASMKMKLVSTVNNYTLNKKAQGQKYFTRTENWRDNMMKGIKRMKQAYMKASSFYDALAEIDDRDKYQRDMLKMLEGIEGWESNGMLSDFHSKLSDGKILTLKQRSALERIAEAGLRGRSDKTPEGGGRSVRLTREQEEFLERLRDLFRAAKRSNDKWTMDFVSSIGPHLKGGGSLSNKQKKVLGDKLRKYGV